MFPFINWIAESETKSNQYLVDITVLFILLLVCSIVNSLVMFFICYECLIILLFIILLLFIPSIYRIKTAFFSLMFSILGSISFICPLSYIITSISLYSLVVILPFIIKIPSFPFYYWSPEVHCEANTSISLFLAGLLSKLSIFGIIRFILCTFYSSSRFLSTSIIYIILVGIIIVSSAYFRYYDLKKTIALSSIQHLNLVSYSVISLNSSGLLCSIIIALSHSLSSIGLSLYVGIPINKTNTRLLDAVFFMSSISRLLLSFLLLASNSFPSSINYVGEIFTLISIISIDVLFTLYFLLISPLSTLFWFIVTNRKTPYYSSHYRYCSLYYLLLWWLLIGIYLMGIYVMFNSVMYFIYRRFLQQV